MDREPTQIGRVRHVLGATVTVSLDDEIAGIAPIFQGRLQPIGQIGSLVRIPQGLVDLLGSVTMVGIAELSGPVPPAGIPQAGDRWLQVQLLGEINRGSGLFQRGIGNFPSLEDPVHFALAEQLRAVFPAPSGDHVRVGRLSSAETVPLCLNASKLVVRHAAIVGSTGSGKTTAVASILQSLLRGGWVGSNIIVVDPHGEYASALRASGRVHSVLATGTDRLTVPYWVLPAKEILNVFMGSTGGATFIAKFEELVTAERRAFAKAAKWLSVEESAITADTPIPFDVREVWYRLDWENRETRDNKNDDKTTRETKAGDPETLASAEFTPYAPGGVVKGPSHGLYATHPDVLRLGLLDPRLQFLGVAEKVSIDEDPLIGTVASWLGDGSPVSVLDFSGVPARAADVAIGVILNLVFELALRSELGGDGFGRPSPVLVVLEEAHRYLGDSATDLTRNSANRIAREGRKYGLGLLMVSQRPSELPKTALAQCGTIISLRLTNAEDQGTIKSALPDAISGLASVLPSLRTHEAVVSGEALALPARVLLDNPSPWPQAEDPGLASWRVAPPKRNVSAALESWRGTYNGGKKNG